MARRNARSGGIFLTIAILAGFAWGMAAGNPMKGILIGTALGALAALLLWLLDRRG
jgi:dolichyl-phosphate-mannose--protein O-mannosyl transferase